MAKTFRALGLMSGTSLDGIDAAVIETDGDAVSALGPAMSAAYDPLVRGQLRDLLNTPGETSEAERILTGLHADLVHKLLEENHLTIDNIDIIGFHGQTTDHRPQDGITVQIGDGAALARALKIPVVNDFRRADVAAGGEGAPFAPLYHAARARELEKPLAVLNIGGVANVTWIGPGEDEILAFDTGPGNALIDDWMMANIGEAFDRGGAAAAVGAAHAELVEDFCGHPYFSRPAPKSLDRNDFAELSGRLTNALSTEDGAASLTAITARCAALAAEQFPAAAKRWLVCGGGRHNPILMKALAEAVAVPLEAVEAVGWRGDFLEAEAFAYLAVRSRLGLPLSLPGTTGVAAPLTGGRFHDVAD